MNYYIRKIGYIFLKYFYLLKYKNIKLGNNVEIYPKSKFEGYNKILSGSYFRGELGYASYIGKNSIIIGKIGRYCSIAGNVTFLVQTHPVNEFVSTHPAFYSLKKQSGFTYVEEQLFDEEPRLYNNEYSIYIGNDVYIGHGVTIVGPISIGDGAVIGANSTVTKNVDPYTIVGGNPAKIIKKRFNENEIKFLLDLKWWKKEPQWLRENITKFYSIQKLMEEIKMKEEDL